MDTIIENCKLINKIGNFYVGIKNGKIAKISKIPFEGGKKIDINGKLLLPGFIDPHVHFRDPGLTQKEDFKTGSESAANGGFTTVIDMPNTIPKTNTYKALKEKIAIADKKSIVNYELQAGWNTLEEMEKMISLNPISFKIFMDLENDETLEGIFKDLGTLKKTTSYNGLVAVHCENKAIIKKEISRLKQKEENIPIDYSYARPAKAEDESVKQAIELASANNLNLHICHLSSKKSLNLAKSNNVSYEFTPHHLLLDNSTYNTYGTMIKTNPPLREAKDKINISDIDENTIIGTDHAPHTLEDKNQGVWSSSPGIPGLETVVSLLLTQVNKGNLDLKLIPKILSKNAAKVYNLKNKGSISIGKDADFTVIDLKKEGKFNIENFKTKAKYSPFDGQEYTGEAVMSIKNGKTIMNKL